MKKAFVAFLFVGALAAGGIWVFTEWTINRFYVDEGYSLQLRYKGPLFIGFRETAKPGYWAKEGQIGILEKMRGPGRHFYCPVWYERTLVPDTLIKPGEVGIVTCKLGDPLPPGEFLVDGEIGKTQFKGVLRKVLAPGRYRINPYGYDVKIISTEVTNAGSTKKFGGWVDIPTGYCGVVTNLTDNPLTQQKKGIQDKVLQPGLYPINPREQQIDVIEVGFRETTVQVSVKDGNTDESGEASTSALTGGIAFPSSDGFTITMDFTSIWGLMPEQAPNAIRKFGGIDLVENKIVLPQIESICRNNGSEYSAIDLLVGKRREEFQNRTLDDLHRVLEEKEISLLYGLVRHIYIPKDVRQPIQAAFIADELKLTREQEQQTAIGEADLRQAEQRVTLETETVNAQTEKLVAERVANGQREAAEIEAETEKLVAAIAKKTAALDAQAALVAGQAEADGKKAIETAKAGKFKLAVDAFGSATAYNNWIFATGLPDDIELKFLYAGPGTLWTDSKNLSIVAPSPPTPTSHEGPNGRPKRKERDTSGSDASSNP